MLKQYSLYLVLIACLFSGCATTENTSPISSEASSEYGNLLVKNDQGQTVRLRPGDSITIKVWGFDKFNTEQTVNGQGMITMPLVGEVEAEGLSKQQLKKLLKKKLSEYIKEDIIITLNIQQSRANRITVLGSVGRPDNYSLMEEVTIFEILSTAGGTTEQADLRNIKIYRHSSETQVININLSDYLKKRNGKNSMASVKPGDIVYVPEENNLMNDVSSFMRDVVLMFGFFRVFN